MTLRFKIKSQVIIHASGSTDDRYQNMLNNKEARGNERNMSEDDISSSTSLRRSLSPCAKLVEFSS